MECEKLIIIRQLIKKKKITEFYGNHYFITLLTKFRNLLRLSNASPEHDYHIETYCYIYRHLHVIIPMASFFHAPTPNYMYFSSPP